MKQEKKVWYAPNKFESYGEEEIKAVEQWLRDGWIAGFGAYVATESPVKLPLKVIVLTSDKSKTQTYAHNDIGNDHVVVYTGKRNLGDILRSLAHEIIHYAQKYDGSLDKYKNPGATGTPIENNLLELWSIFDFLIPGYLSDYDDFANKFIKEDNNQLLRDILKPFILRRKKIDVLKEIEKFIEDLKINNCWHNNWWHKVSFPFKNKIKNTPTIEIRLRSTNNILDYIEDCLTSNHRDFSLDEKIEAIEHLDSFIPIRTKEWLSGIKNAIR